MHLCLYHDTNLGALVNGSIFTSEDKTDVRELPCFVRLNGPPSVLHVNRVTAVPAVLLKVTLPMGRGRLMKKLQRTVVASFFQ